MIFKNNSTGGWRNNVNVGRYAGSEKDGVLLIGSTALAQSLSKAENAEMDAGFVGRSQAAQYDVDRELKRLAGRMAAALIGACTNHNDVRSSDVNAPPHAIVKKGKSILRKLSHGARHGVDPLRTLTAIFGSSHTGSFTLPQPYAQPAALCAPKDFERLGLHSEEAAAFQGLATEKQLDIFVRTGTSTRTINVGRPGLRPKPAGVYRKTSKDADQLV